MSFLRPVLRPAPFPTTAATTTITFCRFASGRPHKGPRYIVPRSANGNLPVYTDIRNNGTSDFTLIRNVQGEAYLLATDLRITLFRCANPQKAKAKVSTNGQEVVITGAKWKPDIIKWLEARGF